MRAFLLSLMLVIALPAMAVQPDEILPDPVQEARARAITAVLRCVVCRNESVDDSSAEIARDVRLIVRERIVAGDSDSEIRQFMVDRFGEFILLNPQATGSNLILWVTGPVLLVVGLGIAVVAVRRRRPPAPPLSAEEEARLKALLDE
ncbi:MAG: cytochrome c-type biogenesis protein CcmH [Pararhodobacter sp.]